MAISSILGKFLNLSLTFSVFFQGKLSLSFSVHSGEFENVKACSIHPDGWPDLLIVLRREKVKCATHSDIIIYPPKVFTK